MNATSYEFEKIKNSLIYFDWNIISYIHGLTNINDTNLLKNCNLLKEILNNKINRDEFGFPYSTAHFSDIAQGNSELYNSKIDVLYQFTKGWTLHEDITNNYSLRLDKCLDIETHFNWYFENYSQPNKNSDFDENIIPIMEKASKLFREYNNEYQNKEWTELIDRLANIIINPYNGLDILRLNRDMRKAKSPIEGFNFSFPKIDSNAKLKNSYNLKKLINTKLSESIFPFKNSDEFFKFVMPKNISILSPFENDILRLSNLSDFFGISNEKLKKNTSFISIINDIKHLVHGLRTNIFISNDFSLIRKASFIATWMDLDIQILSLEDFINLYN